MSIYTIDVDESLLPPGGFETSSIVNVKKRQRQKKKIRSLALQGLHDPLSVWV